MTPPLPEPRWYAVGPHGFYDLVRLARRGRSSLVRVGYVAALFVALAVVYHNEASSHFDLRPELQRESINTNARIAERFSITILIMQNIAVLVLMPIYIAASVHEERDRRTLPMLFTTQLTAHEIVNGKWLARVGHVGGILLGGLPILSFAQLWGGIDMPMIAANFCNAGLWLISIASFSAMMATQSRTLIRGLVKTYLLLFGAALVFTCCCVPWSWHGQYVVLVRPDADATNGYGAMWTLIVMMAVCHGAATILFLWRAGQNLDGQRGDQPTTPDLFDAEVAPTHDRRFMQPPPVADNAILWKERYISEAAMNVVAYALLPILLCMVGGYVVLRAGESAEGIVNHRDARDQYFTILALVLFLSFSVYAVQVVFRLTGCIVREREQQTLESLLTLPISRLELLRAKVTGVLLRYWPWLLPVAVSWLILFGDRIRNPLPGVLALAALVIHLSFFAMLALFLSVVCRTSVAAYASLGTVALLLFVGTLFMPNFVSSKETAEWFTHGLNPIGCWMTIANAWRSADGVYDRNVIHPLIGYYTGAMVLGLSALKWFTRTA
ncbi:MAG: ABC transporter permease subunit [Planctomycetes bacterium]|nr:ABC transporter permease subunit [Planctomycetota bacterium]